MTSMAGTNPEDGFGYYQVKTWILQTMFTTTVFLLPKLLAKAGCGASRLSRNGQVSMLASFLGSMSDRQ
jgi:hypothetical protein